MDDCWKANMTDEELVQEALEGKSDAFDPLVRRYSRAAYSIAYVNLKDRHAAEDVVQEAFLRAYLHLDHLTEPKRFAAWLGRITRNLACDWQRQGRRLAEVIPAVARERGLGDLLESRGEEGLSRMEQKEQYQAVREAVLRLRPERAEVVMLHFCEGLNPPEIARILDVHPGSVRRQLRKATVEIKASLGGILHDSLSKLGPSDDSLKGTIGLLGIAAGLSQVQRAAVVQAAGGSVWGTTAIDAGCLGGAEDSGAGAVVREFLVRMVQGSRRLGMAHGILVAALGTLLVFGSMRVIGSSGKRPDIRASKAIEAQPVRVPAKAFQPVNASAPRPPVLVRAAVIEKQVVSPIAVLAAGSPNGGAESDVAGEVASDKDTEIATAPADAPEAIRFDRARTVQFPADRSLGVLKTRPHSEEAYEVRMADWREYCQATGLVSVPADTDLGLWVSPDGAKDLSALANLRQDDLQWLCFMCLEVPPSQWRHVGELRRLRTLILWRCDIHDGDLRWIGQLTSLRRLDFSLCSSITDAAVRSLENLGKLEYLNLDGNITDDALNSIARLGRLKLLDLSGTRIRGPGLAHLEKLTNLEHLSLWQNPITDDALGHLGKLSSLRGLGLGGTKISDKGLSELVGLSKLESLNLEDTRIGDKGLEYVSKLANLRTLDLHKTRGSDAGFAHLAKLKSLENLEPPNGISNAGVAHLRGMRLKSLDLGPTSVNSEGLAHLEGMPLTKVLLPSNLTDDDLAEIAKFKDLEQLWIQNSPAVTDAGIARLSGLKSLNYVLLYRLRITPSSYAILQEWPELRVLHLEPPTGLPRFADGTCWLKYVEGCPKLEALGLRETDIIDRDLSHLQRLPALRELFLAHTGITDEGLSQLKDVRTLELIDVQLTKVTAKGAEQLARANVVMTGGKITPASNIGGSSELGWQGYVGQFIETYRLDASQQQTVHSILREAYDEAYRYRQSHQVGHTAPTGQIRPSELRVQVDMFNRLKERLERVPTQGQRMSAGRN